MPHCPRGSLGYSLLALVWGVAIVGMLVKHCGYLSEVVSSIIYCDGLVMPAGFRHTVEHASHAAFGWLLAGGIIYTVGGIIYA